MPVARVTIWAAVSEEAAHTTAMRSLRACEALSTLSRKACWMERDALSQVTTSTSSWAASRAKAGA